MKYRVTLGDKNYEVEVERGEAILLDISDVPTAPAAPVSPPPAPHAPQPSAPSSQLSASSGGEPLTAPMPGTVLSVKAAVGQQVKKGDVLLIIEAMKMENEITAPRDAKIVQIITSSGVSVNTGDPLLVLG